jgi:hypothetical protein
MDFSACVNSCTFVSSSEFESFEVNQYYKYCKTCLIDLSFSIVCASCAFICHDKHDLGELQYGNVVCDCGKMQLCKFGKFQKPQIKVSSLASIFTSFGRKRKVTSIEQNVEVNCEISQKKSRGTSESSSERLFGSLSLNPEVNDEPVSQNNDDDEYDYSDEENEEQELSSNLAQSNIHNLTEEDYVSGDESSVDISSLTFNRAVTSVENSDTEESSSLDGTL